MYGLSRLTVYIGLAVLSISKYSIRGDVNKRANNTEAQSRIFASYSNNNKVTLSNTSLSGFDQVTLLSHPSSLLPNVPNTEPYVRHRILPLVHAFPSSTLVASGQSRSGQAGLDTGLESSDPRRDKSRSCKAADLATIAILPLQGEPE